MHSQTFIPTAMILATAFVVSAMNNDDQIVQHRSFRNQPNLLLNLDELPRENMLKLLTNKEQYELNAVAKVITNDVFQKSSRAVMRKTCPGDLVELFLQQYFRDVTEIPPGLSKSGYTRKHIPANLINSGKTTNECLGALSSFCRDDKMHSQRSIVHFDLTGVAVEKIRMFHSHYGYCQSMFYVELTPQMNSITKEALEKFILGSDSSYTLRLSLKGDVDQRSLIEEMVHGPQPAIDQEPMINFFQFLMTESKFIRHISVNGRFKNQETEAILNAIRNYRKIESLELRLRYASDEALQLYSAEIANDLPITALTVLADGTSDNPYKLGPLFPALAKHSRLRFLMLGGYDRSFDSVHDESVAEFLGREECQLESFILRKDGPEYRKSFSTALGNGFELNKSLKMIRITSGPHIPRFGEVESSTNMDVILTGLKNHPTVTSLTVEGGVTEIGIIALGNLLSTSDSLERLRVNDMSDNPSSWARIFEGLSHNSVLKSLDLGGKFSDNSVELLATILENPDSSLTALSLDTVLQSDDLHLIIRSVSKSKKLQELKLSTFRLFNDEQSKVAHELSLMLAQNTRLRKLKISRSKITASSFQMIMAGLAKNSRSALHELSLTQNEIGLKYGDELNVPWIASLPTLKVLDLSYNRFHDTSLKRMTFDLKGAKLWKVTLDYNSRSTSRDLVKQVTELLRPITVTWSHSFY